MKTAGFGAAERGFTLAEMLVALALFAVISAVGVGLLRGSVTGQAVMQDRLAASGKITRLHAIMVQDLAHAAARPTRGATGAVRAAFAGDAQGFTLVRTGAATPDSGIPGVQRLTYRLVDGGWHRIADAVLDGAGDAGLRPPDGADALLNGLDGAAMRYRAADGRWQDSWSVPPGGPMPRVVEVTLTPADSQPLTMAFLLPAGPPQPAPPSDGAP